MVEPHEEKWFINLCAAKQTMTRADYNIDIYPVGIIYDACKAKIAPKCVFIPDRRIIRLMIDAVMTKSVTESDENFMVRFGIIYKENRFLDDIEELETYNTLASVASKGSEDSFFADN